jgi:LPS export ABC transporter protein LptC
VRRPLVFVVLLVAFACGEEPAPTTRAELPVGPEGYPTPDQVVENGQHVITMQGVRKAVLVAEQLYFFNQLGKVVGDTIQVTFYDEEGRYQSTLTARRGDLEQGAQNMVATGDVVVRGTESTIRTDKLRYDPVANQVVTETTTEIVQGGNVIRGRGVTADPGLKSIKITGGSAVLRSEPAIGSEPATSDTAAPTPDVPPSDETPAEPPPAPGPVSDAGVDGAT